MIASNLESRNISLMAIGAFYTRLILKSLVKILNYIKDRAW